MSHPLTLTVDEDAERVLVGFAAPTEGFSLTHEAAARLSGDLAMAATRLKMRLQVKRVKEQVARLKGGADAAP